MCLMGQEERDQLPPPEERERLRMPVTELEILQMATPPKTAQDMVKEVADLMVPLLRCNVVVMKSQIERCHKALEAGVRAITKGPITTEISNAWENNNECELLRQLGENNVYAIGNPDAKACKNAINRKMLLETMVQEAEARVSVFQTY